VGRNCFTLPDGHLSAVGSFLPPDATYPEAERATPYASLLGLAPSGVCQASPLPDCRWSLTPPFQLNPVRCAAARSFLFCGTFRRVTPPGCYPALCPLEFGLSSGRV